MAQLDETLACFDANGDKGKPLPADVAWEIDRVHMRNRLPIFASDRVGRDWDGAGEIGERVPGSGVGNVRGTIRGNTQRRAR